MASSVIKNQNTVIEIPTGITGIRVIKVGRVITLLNNNTGSVNAQAGDVLWTLPRDAAPNIPVDFVDAYSKHRITINDDGTIQAKEAITSYTRFTVTYISKQ